MSSTTPRTVVGGNWKMNTDRAGGVALARSISEAAKPLAHRLDTAIFPPFVYLPLIADALHESGSTVWLGAQDCYHAEKGAFTGEVSVGMLKDVGVQIVLAGHSERRHVLHEGDDLVNLKVRAILNAGLRCILCVGEKLEQRVTGQTDTVNERQLRLGLREVSAAQSERLIIAYEPVWAIGTGKTATPDDVADAHRFIRRVLQDLFGDAAARIPIQYGGSATAATAPGLCALPEVNGALVGGASLKHEEFATILHLFAARG